MSAEGASGEKRRFKVHSDIKNSGKMSHFTFSRLFWAISKLVSPNWYRFSGVTKLASSNWSLFFWDGQTGKSKLVSFVFEEP